MSATAYWQEFSNPLHKSENDYLDERHEKWNSELFKKNTLGIHTTSIGLVNLLASQRRST